MVSLRAWLAITALLTLPQQHSEAQGAEGVAVVMQRGDGTNAAFLLPSRTIDNYYRLNGEDG